MNADEKIHIPIFQDESIFRSNDLRRRVWVADGRLPLRKKGQGRAVHVSDFILEIGGQLRLSEEQIVEQEKLPEDQQLIAEAREIIYPGKNSDGWWNAERLCNQVSYRIIFKYTYSISF